MDWIEECVELPDWYKAHVAQYYLQDLYLLYIYYAKTQVECKCMSSCVQNVC